MAEWIERFLAHPFIYTMYLAVATVLGLIQFYLYLHSKKDEVQQRTAKEQEDLISTLDHKMTLLRSDVTELQEKLADTSSKLDAVLKENARLVEILQGRDQESIELRTSAQLAITQINALYEALIIKKGRRTTVGH